jgi:hypothetical protein
MSSSTGSTSGSSSPSGSSSQIIIEGYAYSLIYFGGIVLLSTILDIFGVLDTLVERLTDSAYCEYAVISAVKRKIRAYREMQWILEHGERSTKLDETTIVVTVQCCIPIMCMTAEQVRDEELKKYSIPHELKLKFHEEALAEFKQALGNNEPEELSFAKKLWLIAIGTYGTKNILQTIYMFTPINPLLNLKHFLLGNKGYPDGFYYRILQNCNYYGCEPLIFEHGMPIPCTKIKLARGMFEDFVLYFLNSNIILGQVRFDSAASHTHALFFKFLYLCTLVCINSWWKVLPRISSHHFLGDRDICLYGLCYDRYLRAKPLSRTFTQPLSSRTHEVVFEFLVPFLTSVSLFDQ